MEHSSHRDSQPAGNMPQLRPITPADNATIATIIRSVLAEFGAAKPGTVYYDPTTDDLHTLFAKPGAAYHVAHTDGTIWGGAGVYPTPGLPDGCCELVKLYLLPEARGLGLGKALIENCFRLAKEMGYTQVYLETMPELSMAVSLYERCGFRYLPAPLGNSGHFGCNIWMVRDL